MSAAAGLQAAVDEKPLSICLVPPAVVALQGHLRSLRALIETLTPEAYCASPSRASGSVGEHVRHCLDHARALLSGRNHDELSYDSRLRGTRIETHPAAAADEIVRLCLDLDGIDQRMLDRRLRLETLTNPDAAPVRVATTVGRELAFVIQHTIHHAAIIAILLEGSGHAIPHRFGYAPSTPLRG